MTPLHLEIREQLVRYLAGLQSLVEFEIWFVSTFWSVEDDLDPQTRDLGYEIQHLLAESSNGHWTEDDLRRMFRNLVVHYRTGEVSVPQTGSASVAVAAKNDQP